MGRKPLGKKKKVWIQKSLRFDVSDPRHMQALRAIDNRIEQRVNEGEHYHILEAVVDAVLGDEEKSPERYRSTPIVVTFSKLLDEKFDERDEQLLNSLKQLLKGLQLGEVTLPNAKTNQEEFDEAATTLVAGFLSRNQRK